ncbi:penicillin-binding protein [Actinoallomurus rhizosphaericola]|uniref:penicillin-binding protein n=1 Tax=Actinoallomurus rhizosphaericola TaxID=2952536 RepID=UPI0020927473|nr:transglycosylase domain-containing protein [Actinoallomurus rhizosphaericola]MCO5994969.1 penicillin-binding protein [Actinoallomurus rhizosphaericola]
MTVEKADREHAIVKLLRLIGAALVAGVLVSFLALPAVGSAGMATRDASDSFNKLPADFSIQPPPERTTVYSADGQVIATFYHHNRESVRLDQVSPLMQKAVVAIEDSRFYQHGPLDMKGSARALVTNAQEGGVKQGGSTLTQQYVKNLLVESADNDKEIADAKAPTFGRKLRELRYAVNVEKHLTKDQILQGYLNIAYFGAGAYGVQAAAQRYFSKDAADLTLPEAALLAGITNSPSYYDPTIFPDHARDRRNTVLYRMAELKMITKQQADQAAAQPIKLHPKLPKSDCVDSKVPFFCQYVKNEILGNPAFGKTQTDREKLLYRGGLTIRTTIDMKAQKAAQAALSRRPSHSRTATEAMVKPGTGEIKAMVVSRTYGTNVKKGETQLNLAADYAHGGNLGYSAGSTFKIFTLAAALDKGMSVGTSFPAPTNTTVSGYRDCKGNGSEPWPVQNAEKSKAKSANLETGTWESINTFYAYLERSVGLCDAVKMAQNFGMKRADGKPLQQNPAQVLGTNEIDVTHLAAAYAGFAARGEYCTPIAITEVTDSNGKKINVPKAKCTKAVDTDVADEVTSILQGVLTKGTARGEGLGRPAAGKTGTCESFTCAVFAGYTPDLAAAVWYGDPEAPWGHRNYGVYGADVAPIWRASMLGALRGTSASSFHTPVKDFGTLDQQTVPNVQGMPVQQAKQKIEKAGFSVQISPRAVDSNQPANTVVYTSPSSGQQADQDTTVILFLSNGSGSVGAGGANANGKGKRGNGKGNGKKGGGFSWPPFGN